MPTPRLVGEVSKQIRVRTDASTQGQWIEGTVVAVTGAINAQYQVYLDSNDYVFASSVIESPIVEGDRVFVVKTGTSALIVGM